MNEKELMNKVKKFLESNDKLSGYVKQFTVGGSGYARKLFPYIDIENARRSIQPRSIGPNGVDEHTFSFDITCETGNLAPERAYSGEHGILQLCEDIVSVVWPSDFGGLFERPARVFSVETAHEENSGGIKWKGVIRLEGKTTVSRGMGGSHV